MKPASLLVFSSGKTKYGMPLLFNDNTERKLQHDSKTMKVYFAPSWYRPLN